MTTLDGYGSINVGSVATTNVSLEAAPSGTGGTKTVTLKPADGIATAYQLQLPKDAPAGKSILKTTSAGTDVVLNWTKTLDQKAGTSFADPADPDDANRILARTDTGNIYYSTSSTERKRLNNWSSDDALPTYSTEHTEAVILEEDTDKYYLASTVVNGFYQIGTEDYKRDVFIADSTKYIVADINGTRTVIARPYEFNNVNLVTLNDSFSCSSPANNNGIIVQKVLDTTHTSYAEWEFTNPGPILDTEFDGAYFGAIDRNVINNNTSTFPQAGTNWGFKGGFITKDDGAMGRFDTHSTPGYFYNNNQTTITGDSITTALTGDFSVRHGDSVQICLSEGNGTGKIELVLVRNGNHLASTFKSGFTILNLSEKRYYMTIKDTGVRFRLKKNPNRYLGTEFTPSTYVLNLADG